MNGISHATGTRTVLKKFSLSMIKQTISIEGLLIYNPLEGFPYEPFVRVGKAVLRFEAGSLLKGKVHIPLAELSLDEVVIVTSKDGELHIQKLKVMQKAQEDPKQEPSAKQEDMKKESGGKGIPFLIDEMSLDLGRVVIKDFSASDEPVINIIDIPVKAQRYTNIDSVQKLVALVMFESVKSAGVKSASVYMDSAFKELGLENTGVVSGII